MVSPEDLLFRGGTLHTRRRRLVVGQLSEQGPAFEAAVTTRVDAGAGFVTDEQSCALQAGCSHLTMAPDALGQCHRCQTWLCATCSQVRCARCVKITCVSCARLLNGVLFCKPCWWRRQLWTSLGTGLSKSWKALRELEER